MLFLSIREVRDCLCRTAALALCALTTLAADTNDMPNWFDLPGMVWGSANAKRIRAGIWPNGEPSSVDVTIFATSRTNVDWRYLTPPTIKFSKVELRDTNGMPVPSLRGKRLDGDLPQRIAIKDLPRTPVRGTTERGSGGGLRDWLFGRPATLADFTIQKVYEIDKEGDYSLTVCAVIYGFSPDYKTVTHLPLDEQFVSRVDLPCVTAKIHLKPPLQEK